MDLYPVEHFFILGDFILEGEESACAVKMAALPEDVFELPDVSRMPCQVPSGLRSGKSFFHVFSAAGTCF